MCHRKNDHCHENGSRNKKLEIALLYKQLESLHRIEEYLAALAEWIAECECGEEEEECVCE